MKIHQIWSTRRPRETALSSMGFLNLLSTQNCAEKTRYINSVHRYRGRRPAYLVWKSRPDFPNTIGNDGLLHQTSWFHHPFSVCLDLGILCLHWISHRLFMFIRFERWEESLDNPSSHNPRTSPCGCSCGADSTAPRSGWSRCSPPSACTSSST